MIAIHPEYIVDQKHNPKAVIVPIKEWNNILEEIEELEDIRAYDKAKADDKDEIISFAQAVDEIRSNNAL